MKLRKLEKRDAPLMLEWMHNESVVENLKTNFAKKTIRDCELFITSSIDANNIHLAVADDNDIYMGTVSLKNRTDNYAEFAIVIHPAAMGKGYAKYAMEEMLRIGFEKLGLSYIFWSVSPDNKRAVRFYDKNDFQRIDMKGRVIEGYTGKEVDKYLWYICKNN